MRLKYQVAATLLAIAIAMPAFAQADWQTAGTGQS